MTVLRCWLTLTLTLAAGLSAARADAVKPQLLAFVAERQGTYELKLADPLTQRVERIELLAERPDAIVWRTDRPEVTTIRSGGVYTTNYQRRPIESLPRGDGPEAALTVQDAWYDSDGTRLVVVAAMAGKSGARTCALFDVPAQGRWRRLPEEGHPYDEDSGCDGLADKRRHLGNSISSARLMREQQCAWATSLCASIGEPRFERIAATLKKATPGLDAVAVLDDGSSAYRLAVGVKQGDTPHLTQPVFSWRRDGDALKRIAVGSGPQLQLARAGSLVLLAREYGGENPLVLDLSSGKTVFSVRGYGAVWVPMPVYAPVGK